MAISGTGWTLLVAAVVELGVGLATVAALVRLRGSLDGDGMGAAIEISVVAGLAARRRRREGLTRGVPLILALGGTRSGKSRFGLATTRRLAGDGRAWFLGTAWSGDPELDDRIRRHRLERPADWPTVDVGIDLAACDRVDRARRADPPRWSDAVAQHPARRRRPSDRSDPRRTGRRGLRRYRRSPGPAVVVSDEVGLGIVPMHPNARAYRDLVGIAHQRLAALADEAYLFVAGLPVTLKGPR